MSARDDIDVITVTVAGRWRVELPRLTRFVYWLAGKR
jgi:hypothetical protein